MPTKAIWRTNLKFCMVELKMFADLALYGLLNLFVSTYQLCYEWQVCLSASEISFIFFSDFSLEFDFLAAAPRNALCVVIETSYDIWIR